MTHGATPYGRIALIELRGTELYAYPSIPTSDAPVVHVTIASGLATLERRRDGGTCTEEWRLAGEELRGGECK